MAITMLDDLLHDRRMTLTELADRVGMTPLQFQFLLHPFAFILSSCQPGDILRFEPEAGREPASNNENFKPSG